MKMDPDEGKVFTNSNVIVISAFWPGTPALAYNNAALVLKRLSGNEFSSVV